MTEGRFEGSGAAGESGGEAFDYSALLDDLRCHSSEWLEDRRVWLVREQRRLHLEELAVLSVLDERVSDPDAAFAWGPVLALPTEMPGLAARLVEASAGSRSQRWLPSESRSMPGYSMRS